MPQHLNTVLLAVLFLEGLCCYNLFALLCILLLSQASYVVRFRLFCDKCHVSSMTVLCPQVPGVWGPVWRGHQVGSDGHPDPAPWVLLPPGGQPRCHTQTTLSQSLSCTSSHIVTLVSCMSLPSKLYWLISQNHCTEKLLICYYVYNYAVTRSCK